MNKIVTTKFGLGNEFIEFRHVMEPFPNPVLITNAEANIIYVNPAWESLSGYSLNEVKGKNPRLLQSSKTDRSIFKKMWQTLLSGQPFYSEDVIDKSKDGKEYQINSTIFPVKHDGRISFYVQIEQDITPRKNLDQLKRQFLQAATHELKTPIAALKLLVQLQAKKLVKQHDESDILTSLQLIDRELVRLTRLINELSDVTRIESGKLKMEMREVELTQIISDVVKQMEGLRKGHKIHVQKAEQIIVVADADRIKQVLINLVNNAIKYSNDNTRIDISVKLNKSEVTIAIKDQGQGIAKSNLEYIFDRYYQIDKENLVGLGLGLYIAKEIIKQHKGKIWVKSEQNKGSTFYVRLKIAKVN